MAPRSGLALALFLFLCGCRGLPPTSDARNPLGWPARGLSWTGFAAADTELPLVRETGRLLSAVGELLDAPALLVEGALTLDGQRLASAGDHLLVGTGSTFTAAWNVPFFVMPGRAVDLEAYAEPINQALAHLEKVPAERWRHGVDDPREFVFPPGTRVRASGRDLVYEIPGFGPVMQSGRSNVLWDLWNRALGVNFVQERSWGFVVRDASKWSGPPSRAQVITVLHELYHQHEQMRVWMKGWTLIYWPAYMIPYPFTGWHDHWAEHGGQHGAGAVDRALSGWWPAAD